MNLLELVMREFPEWPEGVKHFVQSGVDSELYGRGEKDTYGVRPLVVRKYPHDEMIASDRVNKEKGKPTKVKKKHYQKAKKVVTGAAEVVPMKDTTFQVGDRVKLMRLHDQYGSVDHMYEVGDEFTVVEHYSLWSDRISTKNADGAALHLQPECFMKIE